MLPPAATDLLGLGLTERSPALSFAIDLGDDLDPTGHVEVHPSVVRVTRLTYAEAQGLLDTDADGDVASVLNDLRRFALRARARRAEAGAVLLDLPEVRVRVVDGEVTLTPLPPLLSRVVVQER
jgi:exoribonuclease-2